MLQMMLLSLQFSISDPIQMFIALSNLFGDTGLEFTESLILDRKNQTLGSFSGKIQT